VRGGLGGQTLIRVKAARNAPGYASSITRSTLFP